MSEQELKGKIFTVSKSGRPVFIPELPEHGLPYPAVNQLPSLPSFPGQNQETNSSTDIIPEQPETTASHYTRGLGYTSEQVTALTESPPVDLDLTPIISLAPVASVVFSAVGGIVAYRDTQKKDRRSREEAQKRELEARKEAQERELEAREKELASEKKRDYLEIIKDLGEEQPRARVTAAIRLKSYLDENESPKENYAKDIFDTAVSYLAMRDIVNEDHKEFAFHKIMKELLVKSAPIVRKKLLQKGINLAELEKRTDNRQAFLTARKENLYAANVHLDGLDLEDADLSYLVLDRASFGPITPDDTDNYNKDKYYIGSTKLFKANLSYASLQNAIFTRAYLNEANFEGANLHGADVTNASLSNAKFIQARCEGTNFETAHPEHLKRTDLQTMRYYPDPEDPKREEKVEDLRKKGALI